MSDNRGGPRPGAGRPKGSKNKMTIAREAIAEVLDVDDAMMLTSAIHRRGHKLLSEMERIAYDVTQPVGARIMAAKTILPFMLPKPEVRIQQDTRAEDVVRILQQRRDYLAEWGDKNSLSAAE
jgi:hypothetical protein